MFSRLALAVALVAAVLLALATVALSAPAHALPSAPAPEHHLERRQRPAAGTCGGYQVPGTTDQYYVVCELDPATGAAKGPFSVGDTSLIFEVGLTSPEREGIWERELNGEDGKRKEGDRDERLLVRFGSERRGEAMPNRVSFFAETKQRPHPFLLFHISELF